jgi:hypothetical protein
VNTDLTADIAAFAADVQARAAALTAQANTNVPEWHITHAYLDNLLFAADLLADAARRIGRDGLYRRLDESETTDLDTADSDSLRVDQLLAELATAGAR